jgi:hypothetical protein
VRFVVCCSNQKASPRLRPLDLARLALVHIYFHWSSLSLSWFLREILSEVAKTFDFVVNCVMFKKSLEKKCCVVAHRYATSLPGAMGSLTVTI